MTEEEQTFRVRGVDEDCVPSILRGFSAPVRLINRRTAEENAFLLAYDTDPVTKWFSSRALAAPIVISRCEKIAADKNVQHFAGLPDEYVEALRTTLTDQATDSALKVSAFFCLYFLFCPDKGTDGHVIPPCAIPPYQKGRSSGLRPRKAEAGQGYGCAFDVFVQYPEMRANSRLIPTTTRIG